ncbi:MAG TPA: acyl-CoA desaturase [Bacteroidia bacterium]|jgi:linoleoyl-CoA desaturase|nr:acyl-CoA desaturase [Bacteroidia bacterium]HMU20452.1 acyl-CoA desaturase [Bacteroidia bacterium]
MSTVKFNNKDAIFFPELKQRINQYFEQNKLKPTGNLKLYSKTIILFTILIALYIILVFFTPENGWLSLFLASLLGLVMASIGFNVMHDGAHGSYSSHKWVNESMAHSLNLLGGVSFIWKQKHNINHHSYTNVEGMDDDIDIKPFIRVHEGQKKYWFHRYQHIYGLLLYGITYFFWVFYNDFNKYFSGKIAEHTHMQKMSVWDHVIFWATKIFYVLVFIVFPIYNVGLIDTLLGYGLMVAVTGITIAVVFQLAHVVEDMPFVSPEGDVMKIESEWAVHQLQTTTNFATKNKFISWLLGGLNFQVEHHLFPRISHIHYPSISKIVRQTCLEYNVQYKEFRTMRGALASHILHLRQMGRK